MLRPVSWRNCRLLLLAAVSFALLASSSARADDPNDGMDVLNEKFNKVRSKINEYFGSQAALDLSDATVKETVDVAAMWITYRLDTDIWVTLDEPGRITREVIDTYDAWVKKLLANKENPDLGKMFAQRVIVHALEVIHARVKAEAKKPIMQVNAARVLAGLAVLRPAELADPLLTLLKDPKMNDGVKYWCLRGLRNLLSLPVIPNTPPVVSKDQMARIVPFLIEFVQRDPVLSSAPTIEEVDGFRLLRREGVRALALVHTPSLGDKVLPALTLLRFVAPDVSIRVDPRLDERFEAALGLAQMETKGVPDYQAGYAAFYIGRFVRDFTLIASANIESQRSNRYRPWRVDAARLIEALQTMQALNPKDKTVEDVVKVCVPALKNIEAGKKAGATQILALNNIDRNPPAVKELFKDRAETAVKLPPSDYSK